MSLFLAIFLLNIFFIFGEVGGKELNGHQFYPTPKVIENYKSRRRVLTGTQNKTRIAFANNILRAFIHRDVKERVFVFAKGKNAENMIIMDSVNGNLNTIFKVRAFIEVLPVLLRNTPIYRKFKNSEIPPFLDLAKMNGFKTVIFTDGDKYSFRFILK
jgi:hypothetical protein